MPDEIFENCQDMLTVTDDPFEQRAQLGLPPRLAVPFRQDGSRNLDIPAQLLCGVAAQKQAIEKCRFALRELKVLQRIFQRRAGHRRVGQSRHVAKSQFTGFAGSVKSTCCVSENNRSDIT